MAKKTTKKAIKKIKEEFSVADVSSDFKDFDLTVMTDDVVLDDIPYRIPFMHEGLQKITGGIMGGKFAEISGNSQSGKSYLLYELMAECQKMGGVNLLFDGERAFETAYAKTVGLNLKNGTFVISNEIDMDKVFKLIFKFIKSVRAKKRKIPILIGIDSFPALQCKADLENMEAGKDPRGYAAMQKNAKFSFWIEKIIGPLGKYDVTLVLLNQTRIDNSIMYGDKTVTLCETVIRFWATQRIRGKLLGPLKRKGSSIEKKTGKTIITGMRTLWKTIKNRIVKPNQEVITDIRYVGGVDPLSGLDELFINEDLIKEASSTIGLDGEKLKKAAKGFKVIKPKEGLENKFYPRQKKNKHFEDMIKDYPQFLESNWTGSETNEEDEFEEVDE